mmetsp:Transcript_4251/g.5924  ORF Transcript_4251/g.5924 Transcript_4251/m.5924 type:complete len:80 (+) Transcript_4251:170-409(+)
MFALKPFQAHGKRLVSEALPGIGARSAPNLSFVDHFDLFRNESKRGLGGRGHLSCFVRFDQALLVLGRKVPSKIENEQN